MKLGSLALLCLAAAPAAAGPLADSLKRHSERDVATLRDQRSDVGARCTLGAVYAKRKDLSRAHLYLAGCVDATLPDEVASEVVKIAHDVERTLRDSDLSKVEILVSPEEVVLTADITALPGETFPTPATVYVKAGTYTVSGSGEINISRSVVVEKHSRTVVILETPRKAPEPKVKGPKKIDFVEDHGSQTQQTGAPPDVKHDSILPKKYEPKVAVVEANNPFAIEDPMATRKSTRAPRAYWLGLRLGGGMFDDDSASARAGVAFAATARYPIAPAIFLAGRADWSRRGSASVDTLGASAGVGYATNLLGLSIIGQLRGDLRFGDAMTSRGGLATAFGVELALPRTPMTAGIRFEQGLTTIAPGARDRAILFEVGVDLR